MNTKTTLITFLMIMLLTAGNSPAELELPSVEFSGFADVLWQIDNGPEDSEDFAIGQAEIDLAASLSDRVNLEMALAYDPDSGSFGLGALVMDLALLGSGENHFHHSNTIENAGLLIGQMDVPFGIDWMFYPSLDRQFITGPLVVADTHDGWNDLGIAVYLETSLLNAVIYRLNGTGYEAPFLPDDSVGGDISGAFGGRLGLNALSGFELGGSFASIGNQDGDQVSSLWGVDAQWATGPVYFKGEYIVQKVGLDAALELQHDGSYVEGMYHPGGYFLLARYGSFSPEGDEFSRESRVCLGAGYVVQDGAEIRLEHQIGIDVAPDRTVAQFVVGF
jgi:hypothetical protein